MSGYSSETLEAIARQSDGDRAPQGQDWALEVFRAATITIIDFDVIADTIRPESATFAGPVAGTLTAAAFRSDTTGLAFVRRGGSPSSWKGRSCPCHGSPADRTGCQR